MNDRKMTIMNKLNKAQLHGKLRDAESIHDVAAIDKITKAKYYDYLFRPREDKIMKGNRKKEQ